MKKYELVVASVNSEVYAKPITVLVIEPDNKDTNTGAMLFTHGWGGNRFQHQDKMEYSADRFNLVCVSVEYRQSGYDFNPVTGAGAYLPYDASFYQVFDVLNGFREILRLNPEIDRERLFHYGGSQGGHIALLSAIFAPDTFATVYSSCALVELSEAIRPWAGREFASHELSIRSVVEHADMIKTPLIMEHGTADATVPHAHAEKLEAKLKALNKPFKITYYEGGGHSLEPAISKLEAFKQNAPDAISTQRNKLQDDFAAQSKISINCGSKSLLIDWTESPDSVNLFKWIDN